LKKINANYFETGTGVIPALPDEIKKKQSSAMFVSRVYDDTPLMKAGIKEGDLIIAIDNQQVETPNRFRKLIDESAPGEKRIVSIYRDGQLKDLPVVVGKETYQKWGYFSLGFRLGTEFDPIPHPEFDILHILSYKRNDTRLELNSPEYKYYRHSLSLPPDSSDRNAGSEVDAEGWDLWLGIFGISKKKIILNQES
jgi:serine protease Do